MNAEVERTQQFLNDNPLCILNTESHNTINRVFTQVIAKKMVSFVGDPVMQTRLLELIENSEQDWPALLSQHQELFKPERDDEWQRLSDKDIPLKKNTMYFEIKPREPKAYDSISHDRCFGIPIGEEIKLAMLSPYGNQSITSEWLDGRLLKGYALLNMSDEREAMPLDEIIEKLMGHNGFVLYKNSLFFIKQGLEPEVIAVEEMLASYAVGSDTFRSLKHFVSLISPMVNDLNADQTKIISVHKHAELLSEVTNEILFPAHIHHFSVDNLKPYQDEIIRFTNQYSSSLFSQTKEVPLQRKCNVFFEMIKQDEVIYELLKEKVIPSIQECKKRVVDARYRDTIPQLILSHTLSFLLDTELDCFLCEHISELKFDYNTSNNFYNALQEGNQEKISEALCSSVPEHLKSQIPRSRKSEETKLTIALEELLKNDPNDVIDSRKCEAFMQASLVRFIDTPTYKTLFDNVFKPLHDEALTTCLCALYSKNAEAKKNLIKAFLSDLASLSPDKLLNKYTSGNDLSKTKLFEVHEILNQVSDEMARCVCYYQGVSKQGEPLRAENLDAPRLKIASDHPVWNLHPAALKTTEPGELTWGQKQNKLQFLLGTLDAFNPMNEIERARDKHLQTHLKTVSTKIIEPITQALAKNPKTALTLYKSSFVNLLENEHQQLSEDEVKVDQNAEDSVIEHIRHELYKKPQ